MYPRRDNLRRIGKEQENRAAMFLEKHGLKIIERNYWHRGGEIDLIAKDDNTFVFIEVKYRSSNRYGEAEEAVTPRKLRNMILTARYYLYKTKQTEDAPCRFDVITIQNNQIHWIKNVSVS